MVKIFTPTTNERTEEKRIFLGGTIDNGNSEDWQTEFINRWKALDKANKVYPNIVIYNPRRETPPENLEKQIAWELEHLENADTIIINLLPNSKSPISLLELGLFARSGKLVVICPTEFYRYTNVKMVCEAYGITMVESMDDVFDTLL